MMRLGLVISVLPLLQNGSGRDQLLTVNGSRVQRAQRSQRPVLVGRNVDKDSGGLKRETVLAMRVASIHEAEIALQVVRGCFKVEARAVSPGKAENTHDQE